MPTPTHDPLPTNAPDTRASDPPGTAASRRRALAGASGYEEQAAALSPDAAKKSTRGTAEGLENYESTLGHTLGKPLYRAVSNEVTERKIGEHAHKIVDEGIDFIADYVKNLDELDDVYVDPKAVDLLADHFSKKVAVATDQWARDSAVPGQVQNYVDNNPEVVTGIAMLAVATAIATDMRIPELRKRFKLTDDLNGRIGVDLGRFQHVAVERIRGELEYRKGNLSMTLGAQHHRDAGVSIQAGLKFSW